MAQKNCLRSLDRCLTHTGLKKLSFIDWLCYRKSRHSLKKHLKADYSGSESSDEESLVSNRKLVLDWNEETPEFEMEDVVVIKR